MTDLPTLTNGGVLLLAVIFAALWVVWRLHNDDRRP